MDTELDNLWLEDKGALFQHRLVSSDKLFLAISGTSREKITGNTRSALVSHVIKYVEELSDLEDEGMSEMLSLMDMIRTLEESRSVCC